MAITWWTGDWHFGHLNALDAGQRPFPDIEAHDAGLIARHNARVGPTDEVWVLGNAAMGNLDRSLGCCQQMNGRKTLVCGTLDRPTMTQDPQVRAAWIDHYRAQGGFAEVIIAENAITVDLPDGPSVLVSHHPYRPYLPADTDHWYRERQPVDEGGWLLHAHVRHGWRVSGRQLNVGLDAWGLVPVSTEEVIALIKDMEHSVGHPPVKSAVARAPMRIPTDIATALHVDSARESARERTRRRGTSAARTDHAAEQWPAGDASQH